MYALRYALNEEMGKLEEENQARRSTVKVWRQQQYITWTSKTRERGSRLGEIAAVEVQQQQ
jgi:hypothetical protein